LLEIPATSAIEEPEEQVRSASSVAARSAISAIYGEIVVRGADIFVVLEYHLGRLRIRPFAFASKKIMARQVVLAIMITISRCPRQTTRDERLDDTIDVVGAVRQESVIACDQIAI
jgi:hypothetical protein